MANIVLYAWFLLGIVCLSLLYLLGLILYLRVRRQRLPLRALLLRDVNLAATYGILVLVVLPVSSLVEMLQRSLSTPAFYILVYLGWFGVFVAINWRKHRAADAKRARTAFLTACYWMLLMGVFHYFTWTGAFNFDSTTLFGILPVICCWSTVDTFLFKWGLDAPAQPAMSRAQV